jgi:uncharacterized protein (DUF2249 family)
MSTRPYELDLRPVLYNGGNPFGTVISALAQLEPGQSLRVLAPFEPVPLFDVFRSRGYTTSAHEIDNGDWEALFTPPSNTNSND